MKKEIDNTFTELPKFLFTFVAPIIANGKKYNNIKEWDKDKMIGENIIIINPASVEKFKVIVKDSALQKNPFFPYHDNLNNGIPVPKTEMYGEKIQETDKSVKMDLWDKNHKIHWIGWILKSWIIRMIKL